MKKLILKLNFFDYCKNAKKTTSFFETKTVRWKEKIEMILQINIFLMNEFFPETEQVSGLNFICK